MKKAEREVAKISMFIITDIHCGKMLRMPAELLRIAGDSIHCCKSSVNAKENIRNYLHKIENYFPQAFILRLQLLLQKLEL